MHRFGRAELALAHGRRLMAPDLDFLCQSTTIVNSLSEILSTRCTYTGIHLLSSGIMTIVVTLGEHIVLSGFETCCVVVPGRSSVWRPNAIYMSPYFRVARYQMLRRYPRNWT
jgi:hypothetical protein